MNLFTKSLVKLSLILAIPLLLASCGWRAIPASKNDVESTLAEVTNQYKRRADLIPNLVNVVKGFASHEKETLEGVVEARAKATQITIDPSKARPEDLKKYQEAQGQLSQALGRLLMVTENYPNLKADANFRDLQSQLEGTENRITIARQRYIESIRNFNNLVTVPPESWTNSMMYHFEKMPQWDVNPEEKAKVEKAPEVKF
jgi:LemA protein